MADVMVTFDKNRMKFEILSITTMRIALDVINLKAFPAARQKFKL